MASGYSPVFRSMLTSSIWEEKPHVKILWLTMLLMKDKRGIVEGSIPGLARMAVITIEQCEEALAVLMAPDKYSRTKELEGRRLLTIDGGWRVVNHEKYSNLVAESSKERVARHRQRAKLANSDEEECNVTCNDPGSRLEVTGLISEEEETEMKKGARRSKEMPEVPMPTDWAPTPEHVSFAANHRLDIELEATKFKGYFDGRLLKSWNGRFSRWLANAVEYKRGDGSHSAQPAPVSPTGEPLVDALGNRKKPGQVFKNGHFIYPLGAEIK